MVEEGQPPEYLEQALAHILRKRDIQTKLSGKDVLAARAGEYTTQVLLKGLKAFFADHQRPLLGNEPPIPDPEPVLSDPTVKALAERRAARGARRASAPAARSGRSSRR